MSVVNSENKHQRTEGNPLTDKNKKLSQPEQEVFGYEIAKALAHEIKNSLTPLKLGAQLLIKSRGEKDPDFNEKFERFSHSFIEQMDNLDHIASELSGFMNMPEMAFEKIDLNQLLGDLIKAYRDSGHLNIHFNHPENIPVIIKAKRNQLLWIFNKVIKNTREAISNEAIEIRLHKDSEWAYIHINHRAYKATENFKKGDIFKPHFTTKTAGSGLILVKQGLSSIGATIHMLNEAAKESIFYISIPLCSA